jgi:hypothetical protein
MGLQRGLADTGYAPGPIDGVYGPRTRGALSAFQQSSGLPGTGIPDGQTLDALSADLLASGKRTPVKPSVEIPANARLNYSGSGWACDRGYRRNGAGCARVEIPANARLNSSGSGWVCDHGYRRNGAGCVRVTS